MFVFLATLLIYVSCSVSWGAGILSGFLTTLWFLLIVYVPSTRTTTRIVFRIVALLSCLLYDLLVAVESRSPLQSYSTTVHLYAAVSLIVGFSGGIILGLLYSPKYYDGSEHTGTRVWPALRRHPIWRPLHAFFCLKTRFVERDVDVGFNGPESGLPFSPILPQSTQGSGNASKRDLEKGGGTGKSSAVLFAVHPHGLLNICPILGFGAYGPDVDPQIEGCRLAATSVLFVIPLIRDLTLWVGGVVAEFETLSKSLAEGHNVMLLPGGLQEFILNDRRKVSIYTRHHGFARLAFQNKVPIVPVFAENENRVTFQLNLCTRVRQWFLRKIGHAFPTFFIGPFPVPLTIHVGRPIDPSKHANEQQLHTEVYIALRHLVHRFEGPYHYDFV